MNTYRYSPRAKQQDRNDAPRRAFLWQNVALPVVLIALAVALVVGIPSMGYRDETRSLIIARMQSECDTAVNSTKYLSRTASTNSNAQLALIRSSIYTMDVMNESYAALEGGRTLVDQSVFTSLYGVLDGYYNNLARGSNVTESLTTLSQQLDALHVTVLALK